MPPDPCVWRRLWLVSCCIVPRTTTTTVGSLVVVEVEHNWDAAQLMYQQQVPHAAGTTSSQLSTSSQLVSNTVCTHRCVDIDAGLPATPVDIRRIHKDLPVQAGAIIILHCQTCLAGGAQTSVHHLNRNR